MEVKACNKCGRLYNYIVGDNFCPSCKAEKEKLLKNLDGYFKETDDVKIDFDYLNDEFDVSRNNLVKFARKEELSVDSSFELISCMKCGKSISSGRFCDRCKKETLDSLNSTYRELSLKKVFVEPVPKMRFIGK